MPLGEGRGPPLSLERSRTTGARRSSLLLRLSRFLLLAASAAPDGPELLLSHMVRVELLDHLPCLVRVSQGTSERRE